jgi:hypothetical protein
MRQDDSREALRQADEHAPTTKRFGVWLYAPALASRAGFIRRGSADL